MSKASFPGLASRTPSRIPIRLLGFLACWVGSAWGAPTSADLSNGFDRANKLYEQAKYREATAAYEQLVVAQPDSPTLQFNLGNAHFKSGDLGRAVVAYRRAQQVLPRDPAIRFNLSFARKQLVGLPPPQRALWERVISVLTQDEWTLLTLGVYWVWMALLILRELHGPIRRALRPYTITVALLILVPLSGLLLSIYRQRISDEAVIIASNASVHYGPLVESQTSFQLRDGAEVQILDSKKLETETWYRIEDTTGRTGWVAELDLLRLRTQGS